MIIIKLDENEGKDIGPQQYMHSLRPDNERGVE